MFYDLNIPWPSSASANLAKASNAGNEAGKKKGKNPAPAPALQGTAPDPVSLLRDKDAETLRDIVFELQELGYSHLAFNQIVNTRFDPVNHANCFAAHTDASPRPLYPDLDPRTSTTGRAKAHDGVTQLSRLTVVLTEQSMGKSGNGLITNNAAALQSYDLLAVRPMNEQTFQHACLTLSELKPFSIDIISLDFAGQPRLPFFLKRSTIHAALDNGVQFEVVYGPAVGAKSDGLPEAASADSVKARRNLIAGVRDLLRATNGKGVFFSSGAMEALGLRGPYDVINLAAIFGLNPAAARDAISSNCRALLLRAQTRKTYRGVVSHPVVVRYPSAKQIPDSVEQSAPDSGTGSKRKQTQDAAAATAFNIGNASVKKKKQKV